MLPGHLLPSPHPLSRVRAGLISRTCLMSWAGLYLSVSPNCYPLNICLMFIEGSG